MSHRLDSVDVYMFVVRLRHGEVHSQLHALVSAGHERACVRMVSVADARR